VREICDRYGILLIIDEVICGFGRTGKWFGIDHFDIQPDLLTMAKGISSGYVPLGAVGCSDEVLEPIDIFQHLHTYANHPVSCATALKSIEIIQREHLVENSAKMGAYFLEGLKSLESHPIVGEARGQACGPPSILPRIRDKGPVPPNRLNNLIARAKAKGLLVKTMGMPSSSRLRSSSRKRTSMRPSEFWTSV